MELQILKQAPKSSFWKPILIWSGIILAIVGLAFSFGISYNQFSIMKNEVDTLQHQMNTADFPMLLKKN